MPELIKVIIKSTKILSLFLRTLDEIEPNIIRQQNLEKHIWESCFYATLWFIWLVRNDYIFNNSTTQAWEVGEIVKTRVAMWKKAKVYIKVYSVKDFKLFLDGIRKVRL
ncbi:hypothetical protein RHMOL_Rhmol02G0121400 [Rhododendron molle]|uniref:Uncharacterized protein n=1 Tax=Rhododendron molle TaxID=49168 RepID=A0ACC0PSB1_RHOML|nr:hypothetical protein RHMOL_Rhmol02G0121400 [Rhododendron molle]